MGSTPEAKNASKQARRRRDRIDRGHRTPLPLRLVVAVLAIGSVVVWGMVLFLL